MQRSALFSPDHSKRFWLWRDWTDELFSGSEDGMLNIIGLNPSEAGDTRDDPTSRKFVGFARRWHFSSVVATNLLPFVATDPRKLPYWAGGEPDNMEHVRHWMSKAKLVVCAWGSQPRPLSRKVCIPEYVHLVRRIAEELAVPLYCIGTTRDGAPLHPSRAAYTPHPLLWQGVGPSTSEATPESLMRE